MIKGKVYLIHYGSLYDCDYNYDYDYLLQLTVKNVILINKMQQLHNDNKSM